MNRTSNSSRENLMKTYEIPSPPYPNKKERKEMVAQKAFPIYPAFFKDLKKYKLNRNYALLFLDVLFQYLVAIDSKEIDGEGFTPCTTTDLEISLKWNAARQRRAIDRLCSAGLIETKRKGFPSKRYIKINMEKTTEILLAEKM